MSIIVKDHLIFLLQTEVTIMFKLTIMEILMETSHM